MNARSRSRGWIFVGVVAMAWLLVDQPWTVVPIGLTAPSGPFDARQYVGGIWTSRVVPAIEADAMAPAAFVESAREAGAGGRVGAVAAEGVVLSIDTSSRVGLALVDVDPADGRADVTVQIGPVIRGTAVRDVLAFVRFTDFANQIEFAAVSSALNERVLSGVLEGISIEELPGRRVRVVGAASIDAVDANALPLIVPVQLAVEAQP